MRYDSLDKQCDSEHGESLIFGAVINARLTVILLVEQRCMVFHN